MQVATSDRSEGHRETPGKLSTPVRIRRGAPPFSGFGSGSACIEPSSHPRGGAGPAGSILPSPSNRRLLFRGRGAGVSGISRSCRISAGMLGTKVGAARDVSDDEDRVRRVVNISLTVAGGSFPGSGQLSPCRRGSVCGSSRLAVDPEDDAYPALTSFALMNECFFFPIVFVTIVRWEDFCVKNDSMTLPYVVFLGAR